MDAPLLAFYGDDVTGSTDAMDALARSGVRTVLFLDTPDASTLRREFPDVDAVGVAGTSRSMSPEAMDEELPPVFEALSELGTPLVHYKICSTFDSAPDVGSIGHAIDVADSVFDDEAVPVLPAAPPLGRYVVFGNMFAEDDADVFRLDRHPTMRDHPVTPMDESDLRRHLGRQTDRSMGIVDVLTVRRGLDAAIRRFEDLRAGDDDIVIFDSLDDDDLRTAGGTIWETCADARSDPTFVVGSSGVQYALADYWRTADILDRTPRFDPLPPVDRLLVMSGSASPLTARQINAALDDGFVGVRIDTAALVDPETREATRQRTFETASGALERGDSVVVFAAHGPDDPTIDETRRATRTSGAPNDAGAIVGAEQGTLLRRLLDGTDLDRVCVAGGDTCGHVTPALDAYALRMRYPLAPGSPLCTAHSRTDAIDGVEIALKGGQLGDERYFVRARAGADIDE